jgi:molybdopterin molybdotransferase
MANQPKKLLSVAEAEAIVRKSGAGRKIEAVPLLEALGRVIAEDVVAPEPSPRFTNSAMDGFAVRWEDVHYAEAARPAVLTIIGESQAGAPFDGIVETGKAARINTGGMLPEGADTVVPIEDVEIQSNSVRILAAKKPEQNVRFSGEEFEKGESVLKKASVIGPAHLGLLSSLGISSINVYIRPCVALVVTGAELISFPDPVKPWQIRDSNRVMLSALVMQAGASVVLSKRVGDDLEETCKVLQSAVEKAEIIVFSGGVSVGPHDLVKPAAQKLGFKTLFWGVSQRPGRPLFFARREDALLFGLPGNPVSAIMCFLYYVQPTIRHQFGLAQTRRSVTGKMAESVRNPIRRSQFFRVFVDRAGGDVPLVYPLARQASHMLTSVTDANGFIFLDIDARLSEGDEVEVNLFPWVEL